jgi:hypothetical protein
MEISQFGGFAGFVFICSWIISNIIGKKQRKHLWLLISVYKQKTRENASVRYCLQLQDKGNRKRIFKRTQTITK